MYTIKNSVSCQYTCAYLCQQCLKLLCSWSYRCDDQQEISITQQVENLLAPCAQTHFAHMCTLRQHGPPPNALHFTQKSSRSPSIVAKLSYTSPVWWGFTSTDDPNRLEALLRSSWLSRCDGPCRPSLTLIGEQYGVTLFNGVKWNVKHRLHFFLPPKRSQYYSLGRNFQIPVCNSAQHDNNFINRMLCRGLNCTLWIQ